MDELQRLTRLVPRRPARPLMPGYRGNRGYVPVLKQAIGHESGLERDLLLLLRFDPTLAAIREQPFTIQCDGASGRTRYTADFITVHGGEAPRGHLIEVKYVQEARDTWRTLKPRLRAGRALAREYGLTFLLLTERQIRRFPLEPIRFLSRFLDVPRDEAVEGHLVHRLAGIGPSAPPRLLAACFQSETSQARALPSLWKLVATGRISADMSDGTIGMGTTLWISKDGGWKTHDPYSRRHMLGDGGRP